MKRKFFYTLLFASVWALIAILFAIGWASDVANYLPAIYTWWVIIGIALLPGFLMSGMFFSNLLHRKVHSYPPVSEDTTVIMCAQNEEATIGAAIDSIKRQKYLGHIRLLVVDNCSTDATKSKIMTAASRSAAGCSIEYLYCETPGKCFALNYALGFVNTCRFLTVDGDTFLEENAVQRIMNHLAAQGSACVAGSLFVHNAKESLFTRMQIYDYLVSIAAIKRYQGSYESTLVAQGAFSAYETAAVLRVGGWKECVGEDIVLTYRLLQQGYRSTYEPAAVGYTTVPKTLRGLYNQRKRWGTGMLEGLSAVKPWNQANGYSKYFTSLNFLIIYLDLAFLFGFVPGVILAFNGYFLFVGKLTLVALFVSVLLFSSVYRYQKRLHIPFQNSLVGFFAFLLFFQLVQSTAAVHGYLAYLFRRPTTWK